MTIDYEGDDVDIEEMPQGCILYNKQGKFVIITTTKDALALVESLCRVLDIQEGNNTVRFTFPDMEMKDKFIGWMSDGGGEQEFMQNEIPVIFNYKNDTVSVEFAEDEDE